MTSTNSTEIRVLAATGVCGSGFRDASLAEAMRRQPHFIGCDCGSTDPGPYPLHELCLLFEVTAPTQEIASSIATITRHQAIHLPIPEWSGLITGAACPYNPAYLERGAVYRFCVNHVVEPDDPYEMFPIEYIDVP
jgi:hypothetical protein